MYIKTGRPEFDNLIPLVKGFLEKDVLDLEIDGQRIRGYRSPDSRAVWIRDYSDMIRGFRYFESDLKSTVQHFADTQSANGRIFDYFTTFPEKLPCEKENWTKYVRVPVEADVEYRFIKAAWLSWQASGDDDFIRKLIPNFERALSYIMTGWYWDKEKFLIKRPYTIDTWDFSYTAGRHQWLNFRIDDDTFWGYMHGDNSGYYEAFRIMGFLYDYFGEKSNSEKWNERAVMIRNSLNNHCWNGSYYTHFVKITPLIIPGVDEDSQLSLSNPMDINRGVTTSVMARSILSEYRKRKAESGAFAEWFSIDPPFPAGIFGDEKLIEGAYCNGGIMPLVGGELAMASFENGFEKEGVEILRQYYEMISSSNESYLWYFPDGTPSSVETSTSPEATPADGWGSSAMLWALIEGLAGVKDKMKGFRSVTLTPRWEAAGVKKADVLIKYKTSGAFVKYSYSQTGSLLEFEMEGTAENCDMNFFIPGGKKVVRYSVNGHVISENGCKLEGRYYRCSLERLKKKTTIELILMDE